MMTKTEREELLELARGLTRETLHGAPPIESTMRLAVAVLELVEQLEHPQPPTDELPAAGVLTRDMLAGLAVPWPSEVTERPRNLIVPEHLVHELVDRAAAADDRRRSDRAPRIDELLATIRERADYVRQALQQAIETCGSIDAFGYLLQLVEQCELEAKRLLVKPSEMIEGRWYTDGDGSVRFRAGKMDGEHRIVSNARGAYRVVHSMAESDWREVCEHGKAPGSCIGLGCHPDEQDQPDEGDDEHDRATLDAAVATLDYILGDTDGPGRSSCPHHGPAAFRACRALCALIDGDTATPQCTCEPADEECSCQLCPFCAERRANAVERDHKPAKIVHLADEATALAKAVDNFAAAMRKAAGLDDEGKAPS